MHAWDEWNECLLGYNSQTHKCTALPKHPTLELDLLPSSTNNSSCLLVICGDLSSEGRGRSIKLGIAQLVVTDASFRTISRQWHKGTKNSLFDCGESESPPAPPSLPPFPVKLFRRSFGLSGDFFRTELSFCPPPPQQFVPREEC